MARASYVQSNFQGGEFAPSAQGRLDLPQYRTALALCQNAYPTEAGAVTRRPGSRFVQPTQSGVVAQLLPFNLSQNQAYLVELTVSGSAIQARYLVDGHMVLDADKYTVTAITTSNPTQITLNSATPWSTGDIIMLQVVVGSVVTAQMTMWSPLVNRSFHVTKIDSTHFTLQDSLTGAGINGAGFTGAIPTINAARITRDQTSFTNAVNLSSIRPLQAETTLVSLASNLTAGQNAQPNVTTINTLPSSSADATFAWGHINFTFGPYFDPNLSDGPYTITGTGPGTITYALTTHVDVNSGAGFQASDVGRLIRIQLAPAPWASGTTYGATGAIVTAPGDTNDATNNVPYLSIDSGATNLGLYPPSTPAAWIVYPNGITWLDATISAINSTSSVQVNIGSNVIGAGYYSPTFRLGQYNNTTQDWPVNGTYYEGRAYFGGANANRIDISAVNPLDPTGTQFNMAPTDFAGNVLDTSGISYNLLGIGLNSPVWWQPIESGIILGAAQGEWLLAATQVGSGIITPTSIQIHQTTKYGSASVLPIRAGIATIFVDRYNKTLNEYLLDPFSQKYGSRPLNVWAGHMTETGGIQYVDFQNIPNPMIWAVSGGKLLGCLYRRVSYFASEMPIMFGWHEHILGSGNSVHQIQNTFSGDGSTDRLAMTTFDNSYYYHEWLPPPFRDSDPLTGAQFVDQGVTGIPYGSAIPRYEGCYGIDDTQGGMYFNGFSYWVGKVLTVFLGGLDMGDYVVAADGTVHMIYGGVSGLGTQAYLISQATAENDGVTIPCSILGQLYHIPGTIGLKYQTTIQRMRPDHPEDNRNQNGPGSTLRKRHYWYGLNVAAGVANTAMISGDIADTPYPIALMNDKTGQPTPQNVLAQGTYRDTVESDYNLDGQMVITLIRPVPLTIAQIVGFLETEEI